MDDIQKLQNDATEATEKAAEVSVKWAKRSVVCSAITCATTIIVAFFDVQYYLSDKMITLSLVMNILSLCIIFCLFGYCRSLIASNEGLEKYVDYLSALSKGEMSEKRKTT